MREIAVILNAGDVASYARALRELPPEHLEQIRSAKVLRRAAALLRAGAYSATVAALRLERRARELDPTPIGELERDKRNRSRSGREVIRSGASRREHEDDLAEGGLEGSGSTIERDPLST